MAPLNFWLILSTRFFLGQSHFLCFFIRFDNNISIDAPDIEMPVKYYQRPSFGSTRHQIGSTQLIHDIYTAFISVIIQNNFRFPRFARIFSTIMVHCRCKKHNFVFLWFIRDQSAVILKTKDGAVHISTLDSCKCMGKLRLIFSKFLMPSGLVSL